MVTLDDILCQQPAIEMIVRACRADRLPHGLIFAGPVGVGKATTARGLASLFLCEKPRELAPCGKCAGCRVFDAELHPDFHLVYRQLARLESETVKAKELSVGVVREFLIAKAANKSVMGIGKVFVVKQADLMTTAAQNALLKTLEEPAGRTLIILLTDQPDLLLPTVRSRCQIVRFGKLDEATIIEQLQKRGTAPDAAAQAARFADGSLGLAMQWLEDGVIARAEELVHHLESIVQGRSSADLSDCLKLAADEYAHKQLARDPLSSKVQATREGLALYLKLAAQFLRQPLAVERDDANALERFCQAIDAIVRAEGYLDANVNIPLVLKQFCGRLERVFAAAV